MRAVALLAAWAGFTGVLILAGFGVVHSSAVSALDGHITSAVVAHRTDVLDRVMKAITWLGSWAALVATGLLLLVLVLRGRLRWLVVLLAVVAWAGEVGAVTLAKHVVQRQRPPKDLWLINAHGWSWPSGHAATAATVFAVLALVVGHIFPFRTAQISAWAVGAVAVAAVGFSRIELGVHWTSDVVISLAFVFSWVAVIIMLFGDELRDAPHIDDRH